MEESRGQMAPFVFALSRSDLEVMILRHARSALEAARELQRALKEDDEAEVRAAFESTAHELRGRAEEAEFLAGHMAPGPYIMAAQDLLGFRKMYAVVDVDRLLLRKAAHDPDFLVGLEALIRGW